MKVGVAAIAGTVILPLLCYMCFSYGSQWLLKRKKEKSDNDNGADDNDGGGDQLDGDPYTMTTVDVFDTEYKTRLAMKNIMGSRYYNNDSGGAAGNISGDDDDAFSIGAMHTASFSGGG
jgi:hypothetical protein